MTIIKKQNKYLHNVYVTSFINLGSLEGEFYAADVKMTATKRKLDNGTDGVETVIGNVEMVDLVNALVNEGNDAAIGNGENDEEAKLSEEPETLLDRLLISGGDESIFTSWEPGWINKYYFLRTKEYGNDAEEWLDNTMNYFLKIYGMDICQDRFATGITEIPRSGTKVRPDSFVINYIQTLGIEVDRIVEKGGYNRAPLSNCPSKKQALVIYDGNGDKSAWNTLLFDATPIVIESTTLTTV